MSPRPADPAVRLALIEAGARLLAAEGPGALTARRLAAAVGASTMAVYTHFEGMDELRRELRREGFARLAAHMDAVRPTRDPVADLSALGWAYSFNALANPHLYRAMFFEAPLDPDDAGVGRATFARVVEVVGRCIDAGRFDAGVGDSDSLAVQLWTMQHGMVAAAVAGLFTPDEVREHLSAMAANLFVGFGDDRAAALASVAKAHARMSRRVPPGLAATAATG